TVILYELYTHSVPTTTSLFTLSASPRDLHSFPTRRSSDLRQVVTASEDRTAQVWALATGERQFSLLHSNRVYSATFSPDGHLIEIGEHTSELQSLAYLVCRLLLEKKKTHRSNQFLSQK